jgi:hypothetical protein
MIDTVASQQDWFASDVKVYKTMVAIDTMLDGLKPGMSAEVTIYADESAAPVLVVPVQAVLGTISMGAQRKCFVVGHDGQPDLRDIVVGMSNERLVEVKSGLKEGDRVVQNPRPLLTDDSDLKPGKDRSKATEDSQGSSDNGQKGSKKSKKKANGPGPFSPGGPGPASPGGGPSPGAGPGAGGAGFGGPPNAQQAAAFMEKMRTATPAERRDMINRIPDGAARDRVRQGLRGQGLEVAD